MSIIRIPYPEPLPVDTDDYVKQNNLLEQLFLCTYRPIEIISGNIQKGTVLHCGGTVYYTNSDTAITGTPSDYVKLTPSGDGSSLSASYVANLTGVTWNQAYNGYYDVSGNLYIFNEAIALGAGEIATVKTKYLQVKEDGNAYVGKDLKVYGSIYDKNGTEVLGMLVESGVSNILNIANNASGDLVVSGLSFTPTAVLLVDIKNDQSTVTTGYTINSITFGAGSVTINITNRTGTTRNFTGLITAALTG